MRTSVALILAGLILAIIFINTAFAQDATIRVGDIMAPWMEMLVSAVAVLVTAILGWIAAQIKAKTGIEIEARHREALQTALNNAAGLVLNRLGDKIADTQFDVRSPIIRDGVLYVSKSVPEAIKNFGLTPEQLAEKLVAKMGLATAPSSVPEPT